MFEVDNRLDLIRPVLLDNYFTEENDLIFVNGSCKVEIDLENGVYNIYWRGKYSEQCITTSDNLNFYFLFGFLSAYELVSRDFKL